MSPIVNTLASIVRWRPVPGRQLVQHGPRRASDRTPDAIRRTEEARARRSVVILA